MLPQELFFGNRSCIFEVNSIETQPGRVILAVFSKQTKSRCPSCKLYSRWLHGCYFRTVKDLPMLEYNVIIKLKTRKFYCRNDRCTKKVFTEQFPEHFLPYKRTTSRLNDKLLKIAMLMGGNPGKRLCDTLNIETSSSSLIRCIHRKDIKLNQTSTHIGIDDWAYRKGHTYGTAIVDLKERRIIDLLPDRETHTVETWLKGRCGIKIVTRDRYANYARSITNGAPAAKQVADRWHLLKNMGDAVKKLLERKKQELRRREIAKANKLTRTHAKVENELPLDDCYDKSPRHSKMQEIKKLYAQGVPIRAIARAVSMSRNTVRKYLHLDEPPRKNRPGSEVLKFADYFKERIKKCPHIEVIQLWKEVKEKGYKGSRSAVYEFLKSHTRSRSKATTPYIPRQSWSPSKISLLIYKNRAHLSSSEKSILKELKGKSTEVSVVYNLVQEFRVLMEKKQGTMLKRWICKVMKCPAQELKAFAKGLLSDFKAIKNAFSLQWSNGQVEGQINKLKTVKRQMYGRAGFNLLRKRMLLGLTNP